MITGINSALYISKRIPGNGTVSLGHEPGDAMPTKREAGLVRT